MLDDIQRPQPNNAYLISYQDQRLFAIQKSSRTHFPIFQKLNEKLRLRFPAYYNLRIDPLYLYDTPDEQMAAIQRSTRTTFKIIQPLHEKMRQKSLWYYKWHIRPESHKIHWLALGLYTAAVTVGICFGVFGGHKVSTKAASNYQFSPISGTLVVGTEQPICSSCAASSEGTNVGSWKGLLADDNYHWVIGSTSAGYDLNVTVGGVALNGANSMIIETELDLDATAPNTAIQICDWNSSTGVDSPADAYCTGGGWRTLNTAKTLITSTSPLQYRYQIYDGYWGDGANPISTPLTDFINGSGQSKIRYYSTINTTSLVAIDFLRITANINPVYMPSQFTNLNTNTGVVTDVAASHFVFASAKDGRYLYTCGNDSSNYLRIEKRFLGTGGLEYNFGTSGVVTGASTTSNCYAIAIDGTYLYTAGTDNNNDWHIEKRKLSDGSLDPNFGTAGIITDVAASYRAYAIAINSNYMYVAGSDNSSNWRIEKRRISDGSLDSGFGTSGVVTGSATDFVSYSIIIDNTYMYVAGSDATHDWRIEKRRLSDGSLDSGFGTSGIVTGDSSSQYINSMSTDSIYMYLVGSSDTGAGFRIEKRKLSDGSVDSNFGSNGIITEESSSSSAYSIAIDSTFMYIVDGGNHRRVEKRYLSDGSFDNNFGTSGVITEVGTFYTPYTIVVDSTYIYIAGQGSTFVWSYEKRKLSDGSLDNSASGNSGFGLAAGGYDYTQTGYNGSTTPAGQDAFYSGAAGTASSVANFYWSFKNIKTYPSMNTILVRSKYGCDTTNAGVTYRPKIYNFSSSAWEDLTTGSIACSTTDATSAWAKNNVTIANYINNGEIRVGFYGLNNSTITIRADWIYLMLGTTNTLSDAANCFVSFGSNSANDCTNSRDLDMTAAAPNTWNIASELESNTMAHDFFPLDIPNNGTAENSAASHIKFNVAQPANTAVTNVYYAGRFMEGTSGTGTLGLMDYSGYNGTNGGFSDVGSTATSALVYTDTFQAGIANQTLGNATGLDGIINNPFSYLQSGRNEMWMRLRTSAVTTGAVTNQWDFAMVTFAWIEDSAHSTKSYQFTPTGGNLVTGTAQPIQAAAAASNEGVNVGSWKGTIAQDNYHWVIASTASGYDANLEFSNVALNGANQMQIESIFDLDATTADTLMQICDWTSAVGVSYPADAQCTGGGWRNLALRNTISNSTSANAYHYQVYNGYWGDGANKIDTPLTNFVNSSDNNKVKIRFYSTVNTTSQVAIDMARIYPVINSIYSPAGMTNLNTNSGVVTSAAASNYANATAKDSRFLYTCGDDSSSYMRIEKRLLGTGGLDYNFGTSGVVTGAATSRACKGIAIDGTWMYVVGYDSTPDWRIEKRRLSDGSLDPNFGTAGIVTAAATSQMSYGIAIDSTYMYVVGYDNNYYWRIEKRRLSDGTLDSNFGTSGVVTGASTSQYAWADAIAIDSTYMYVAGGDNNLKARIEKRRLSDGTLDSNFGTSGIVTGDSTSGSITAVTINDTWIYTAGSDSAQHWRIEKRRLSDGTLDSNFGTSGVVTGASTSQFASAIAIDGTWIFVAGNDNTPDWRIEKRRISDGTVDNNFGASGIITSSSLSQYSYGIVIDSTYLWVAGYDSTPDWRIEKRKLSDGSFDHSQGFGLAYGGYENTIIGYSAMPASPYTANANQTGSDSINSGASGTASSNADFYYSFKNVRTYTGANTILARATTYCSATGINFRPKIYNFTTSSWEDLSSGSLPCQGNSSTTNMWAKNNVDLSNYISNGEARVGFYGLGNGTQIIYVDYIYLQIGTTNTDSSACEISFGTNLSGDCTATRDVDTTAPSQNIWKISKEVESPTFSHPYYPYDNDADSDIELGSAAHVKFSVTPPTGLVTAINFADGAASGIGYNYGVTGNQTASLFDYGGFTGTSGGFKSYANVATNSMTWIDPYASAGNAGGPITSGYFPGIIVNPHFFISTSANQIWSRLSTSLGAMTGTNMPTNIDFMMVGIQWIE